LCFNLSSFSKYHLQPVLPKGKYYTAVGSVVNVALTRMLDDVLALPDIPEVESHRLSELCRIWNALEGLFVEDASQGCSSLAPPNSSLILSITGFFRCRLRSLLVEIFLPL
jgi:hypothetical protein